MMENQIKEFSDAPAECFIFVISLGKRRASALSFALQATC